MSLQARLSVRGILALHALAASLVSAVLALLLVWPGLRSAAVGQRAEDADDLAEALAGQIQRSCTTAVDPVACEIHEAQLLSRPGRTVFVGNPGQLSPAGTVRGRAQLQGGSQARWLVLDVDATPAHLRAARVSELATRMVAVGALALFLFLYALLVRLVARPADRLIAGLERIGSGTIASETAPGFGQVGAAFDRMEHRLDDERRRVSEQVEELRQVNRQLSEARDAVLRQEKLATVGRLSAGVAHEVGNPLAAILGYVEVLRARAGGDPALGEYVDRLERETRRIDRIVQDLLDFARPSRGASSEPIAIGEVIERTVELVETQRRFAAVHVKVAPAPEGLPLVRGDEHYLQQVLLNLLVNAADAMGGKGTVYVSTELAGPPHPGRRAGDARPGHRVALLVRDEGPGIPPADLWRIFDPFFTTKAPGEGTGLGLSICHSLVESFGGSITAANAEPRGAIFRVELPAATPVTDPASASMAS